MELNRIKRFAQESRRKLLTQVGSRLDYVLDHDDAYLRAHAAEKATIERLHAEKGRECSPPADVSGNGGAMGLCRPR
jgi:hypothetical protein